MATREDGSPAASVIVVAVPDDVLLQRAMGLARRPPQPTDASGVVVQRNIAPGRQKLYAATLDGKVEELPHTVEVREGEEVTVEVRVP